MPIKSVVVVIASAFLLLSCSCENESNPTQQTGTKKAYGDFLLDMDQFRNTVLFYGDLKDGPAPVEAWDNPSKYA